MSKTADLTAKQKEYYDERVEFFRGMGIAIPFGLIHEKAISMTDDDVDAWFGRKLFTQQNQK